MGRVSYIWTKIQFDYGFLFYINRQQVYNPSMTYKIIKNNRNNPKLIFEGHSYNKVMETDGSVIWRRYKKSSGCLGRCILTPEDTVTILNSHSHPSDFIKTSKK